VSSTKERCTDASQPPLVLQQILAANERKSPFIINATIFIVFTNYAFKMNLFFKNYKGSKNNLLHLWVWMIPDPADREYSSMV
jgi:hypothetical protein